MSQAGNTNNEHVAVITSHTKILINKPDVFNGDKARFNAWWRGVSTYIRNEESATSDDRKIHIAFSYLRGEKVEEWTEKYYKTHFHEFAVPEDDIEAGWDVSWQEFAKAVAKRFTDTNLKNHAQMTVERFYQGAMDAVTWFQKYELLMSQADYDEDLDYSIHLVRWLINTRHIDQIYGSREDIAEMSYDTWKTSITNLDTNW